MVKRKVLENGNDILAGNDSGGDVDSDDDKLSRYWKKVEGRKVVERQINRTEVHFSYMFGGWWLYKRDLWFYIDILEEYDTYWNMIGWKYMSAYTSYGKGIVMLNWLLTVRATPYCDCCFYLDWASLLEKVARTGQ